MEFAKRCLRGIPSPDQAKGERLSSDLFMFSGEKANMNEVGSSLQSINWDDHPDAIQQLRSQKITKNAVCQCRFKGGVAAIPTADLELIAKDRILEGHFGCDRQPLPDNPFHGNLVLEQFGSKKGSVIKYLADFLAVHASVVEPES